MKRKESYAVPDGQPAAPKDVESRLTSTGTSMHSRVVARSAILIPEVTRQASNSADRRGRSHEARVTRDDEQNLFDLSTRFSVIVQERVMIGSVTDSA